MNYNYLNKKYLNRLNESIRDAKKAKLLLSKIKSSRQGLSYDYDYTVARSNYDWALNKVNIYKELMIDLHSDPVYINSLTESIRQSEISDIKPVIVDFLKNKIDQSDWAKVLSGTNYNVDSFCEMIANEWIKRDRAFNPDSVNNQKAIITFAKLWIKNINK